MIAEIIATALGGRKVGSGWMARCPAHDDREPSLSIRDSDNKVLVRCHAGCDQRLVIAKLKERGLWEGRCGLCPRRALPNRRAASKSNQHPVEKTVVALSIWQSALQASGTPVEAYLAGRGLVLPISPSLRFHPGLRHPSGGFWPCLVALVTRGQDGMPVAIHRTFLTRDGCGKAPVDPAKMMLGPCRGGAVHLGEAAEVLMVGEGIETCLAAMQATGKSAWAALSASGLRVIDLPETVRELIVLTDGDDPGEAAARDCAIRWMERGRRVRIARPPRGMDFNDMLLDGSTGKEERGK